MTKKMKIEDLSVEWIEKGVIENKDGKVNVTTTVLKGPDIEIQIQAKGMRTTLLDELVAGQEIRLDGLTPQKKLNGSA